MKSLDSGILYITVDRNVDRESIIMKFSGDLDGAWIMQQNIIGQPIYKFIRRRGKKWVVVSESGKILGTHDSEEDAKRQLRAIEANKRKMKKHDIRYEHYHMGKMIMVKKTIAKLEINEIITPPMSGRYRGVSIARDKNGYFAMTHRARSKSYKTALDIPDSQIKWIASTG